MGTVKPTKILTKAFIASWVAFYYLHVGNSRIRNRSPGPSIAKITTDCRTSSAQIHADWSSAGATYSLLQIHPIKESLERPSVCAVHAGVYDRIQTRIQVFHPFEHVVHSSRIAEIWVVCVAYHYDEKRKPADDKSTYDHCNSFSGFHLIGMVLSSSRSYSMHLNFHNNEDYSVHYDNECQGKKETHSGHKMEVVSASPVG